RRPAGNYRTYSCLFYSKEEKEEGRVSGGRSGRDGGAERRRDRAAGERGRRKVSRGEIGRRQGREPSGVSAAGRAGRGQNQRDAAFRPGRGVGRRASLSAGQRQRHAQRQYLVFPP